MKLKNHLRYTRTPSLLFIALLLINLIFIYACTDATYEADGGLSSTSEGSSSNRPKLPIFDMMLSVPIDHAMMQVNPNPNPVDPNPNPNPDPVDPNPNPDPNPDPVDPNPNPVDACSANCEAVATCAQNECRGYRNENRNLFKEACQLDCALAQSVSAMACTDQVNTFNQSQTIFKHLCANRANTSPCLQSCSDTADCLINECSHYGVEDRNDLITYCLMNCNASVSNTLNTLNCGAKIQYVAQGLPAIVQACTAPATPTRNACQTECEVLSACAVKFCPDYSSSDQIGIAVGCTQYCSAQMTRNLSDKLSCVDKIIYMAGFNADFGGHCD